MTHLPHSGTQVENSKRIAGIGRDEGGEMKKLIRAVRQQHRGRARLAKVAAAVAAVSLVGTACGTDEADSGGDGGGGTEGAITIALQEEPRSLASWNAYSNDGHPILRNVQEALVNRDPETNEIIGELATSWEQTAPTTWRFTLREGVSFHDGSAFNAESAADGLNYVLSPENAFAMRTFLGPEVTAEAVDESTLDVITETPDPILPTRLYFVTIPSMEAIDKDPDAYETSPVGTGPYKFVEWNRGQDITLEANEDWWGREETDAAMGQNEEITEAKYVFRPETEVRAAMAETGEADFARWLNEDQCQAAPQCVSAAGVETIILRMDTPNPTLSDERIREAIALSFDKAQLMDELLGGGTPAAQIVGESATGFNENLQPFPEDVDSAKQLVQEAAADGVPVDAKIVVTAREGFILRANEVVQVIAQSLQEIGLTGVTSELLETAAFEEQWTAGYDNIPPDRGWVGLQSHGNELMDYSASVEGYYACEGPTSAYCDQTLQKQYEEATTLEVEAREKALEDIAAYVYEHVPVVPIGQPNFHFGLSEELQWTPRLDGFVLLKEMTLA